MAYIGYDNKKLQHSCMSYARCLTATSSFELPITISTRYEKMKRQVKKRMMANMDQHGIVTRGGRWYFIHTQRYYASTQHSPYYLMSYCNDTTSKKEDGQRCMKKEAYEQRSLGSFQSLMLTWGSYAMDAVRCRDDTIFQYDHENISRWSARRMEQFMCL